jgi:hypothetical protein
MLTRTLSILVLCSLFSGCATSPVEYRKRSGASTAATLGVSGALGAAAGSELIGGKKGAAGGALAGLALGYGVDKLLSNQTDRVAAESYEQGRRDERVRVMNAYWQERTLSLQQDDRTTDPNSHNSAPVNYSAGVYEGVRMLPRTETPTDTTNGEPRR